MTAAGFWILAGLLLAGAALLVSLPLWRVRGRGQAGQAAHNVEAYRRQLAELREERDEALIDEGTYREARAELERRLLEDVAPGVDETSGVGHARPLRPSWTALVIVLALPALSVLTYHQVGGGPASIEALQNDPRAMAELGLTTAVEGLERHLVTDPLDDDAWHMLGRGRARAGDLEGAVRALRRALELRGDDPEVLTDLAQLLALGRPDQSLQGEPRQLLERALRVDPDHPEALWLGGMAAAEAGEMGVTVDRWERLLAQEDNVVQARELRRAMAAIRARENQGRDGEDIDGPHDPGLPPMQEGS